MSTLNFKDVKNNMDNISPILAKQNTRFLEKS